MRVCTYIQHSYNNSSHAMPDNLSADFLIEQLFLQVCSY